MSTANGFCLLGVASRRAVILAMLGVVASLGKIPLAIGQQPAPPASIAPTEPGPMVEPKVENLGDNRYRIGNIVVDKSKQEFSVGGVVLVVEPPLEFLAVTKGGAKGYESLLELNTDALSFNLACILIGLEAKEVRTSRFHFDPEEVKGDRVEIHVSWNIDGKQVSVSAAQMLEVGGKSSPVDEWLYVGSMFQDDGQYLAHLDGTLIGFVHDPASIVEHRSGVGLGQYGAAGANSNLVPSPQTPITLTLRKLAR